MAIQVTATKNSLCDTYKGLAVAGAVYTTAPGASQGTEPTGGSPAYARKTWTWGSSSAGAVSASQATFDIPTGTTLVGAGHHSALTAGSYIDGASVTSQAFASQGTYGLTPTFTES